MGAEIRARGLKRTIAMSKWKMIPPSEEITDGERKDDDEGEHRTLASACLGSRCSSGSGRVKDRHREGTKKVLRIRFKKSRLERLVFWKRLQFRWVLPYMRYSLCTQDLTTWT